MVAASLLAGAAAGAGLVAAGFAVASLAGAASTGLQVRLRQVCSVVAPAALGSSSGR